MHIKMNMDASACLSRRISGIPLAIIETIKARGRLMFKDAGIRADRGEIKEA